MYTESPGKDQNGEWIVVRVPTPEKIQMTADLAVKNTAEAIRARAKREEARLNGRGGHPNSST